MKPPEQPAAGWRLKLSAALFGLSIVLPLAGVALVASLDLSGALTASLSGALLLAGEILGVSAVAVAGKIGFAFIKGKILGLLKQYGPPNKVSRLRYRIGLVMFCTPILFGWLSIYTAGYIPGFAQNPLPYALGGDLLLLASLFVLGGDFWDKIRSLFVHDAEVHFTQPSKGAGASPITTVK
jgi:hypothetical protein